MNCRASLAKNVLCSFSAQFDKRQHEMLETAAKYNFDTVSDAAKDIIRDLLPLCVNDDVGYDPLSIDLSSYGYIPTEHFNRQVCTGTDPGVVRSSPLN